jgi:hypothetical protein
VYVCILERRSDDGGGGGGKQLLICILKSKKKGTHYILLGQDCWVKNEKTSWFLLPLLLK